VSRVWLSVVMPTYQGEAYLAPALDSVLAQGTEGIEVIAVDDGSSDRTLEILRAYADRLPLTVVEREHRGNWVANANHGLALARGEWLSLLHQDDLWLPERMAVLGPLARRAEGASMIVHPVWFIDPAGRRLGRWTCPLPDRPRPEQVVRRLLVQNFLAVPAPLVAAHRLREVGGLDEELWYTADWDLWLKLAAAGETIHVHRPLAAFRLHPASLTVAGSARPADFRHQLEIVLHRHLARHGVGLPDAVRRAARFSVEANLTLAARAHGRPASLGALALRWLALGPAAGRRYLRDSRIAERVLARRRLGRRAPHPGRPAAPSEPPTPG